MSDYSLSDAGFSGDGDYTTPSLGPSGYLGDPGGGSLDPSLGNDNSLAGGDSGGYYGGWGGSYDFGQQDFGQQDFGSNPMDLFYGPDTPPEQGPPPAGGGETPWYDNPYLRMGMRFLMRGNPLAMGLMGLYDAYKSKGKSFAGQMGGTLGSQIGGGVAGPLGAMAGGVAGARGLPGIAGPVGGAQEQNTPGSLPTQSHSPSNGPNWQNYGQDLIGLYGNYLAGRSAQNNMSQLQGLYAPGSPYARQMAQSMQRRDAQAGRRSQYGSREVELAAKLAEMQSRNAPAINQQRQVADEAKMRNIQLLFNMGNQAVKDGAVDFIRDTPWWN